jgi:ElaB/YqjD/DUF883 family membrane-anchored ribosome-binding protein
MTERWIDRLKTGRTAVTDRATELSASAREAADGASERIGSVYGQVRSTVGDVRHRVGDAVGPTRDRAGRIVELGTAQAGKLAKEGRQQLDRAAVASRGLIAERPLTAVVIGIGAGLVLGLLANRLGRTDPPAEMDETNDDWQQ